MTPERFFSNLLLHAASDLNTPNKSRYNKTHFSMLVRHHFLIFCFFQTYLMKTQLIKPKCSCMIYFDTNRTITKFICEYFGTSTRSKILRFLFYELPSFLQYSTTILYLKHWFSYCNAFLWKNFFKFIDLAWGIEENAKFKISSNINNI